MPFCEAVTESPGGMTLVCHQRGEHIIHREEIVNEFAAEVNVYTWTTRGRSIAVATYDGTSEKPITQAVIRKATA